MKNHFWPVLYAATRWSLLQLEDIQSFEFGESKDKRHVDINTPNGTYRFSCWPKEYGWGFNGKIALSKRSEAYLAAVKRNIGLIGTQYNHDPYSKLLKQAQIPFQESEYTSIDMMTTRKPVLYTYCKHGENRAVIETVDVSIDDVWFSVMAFDSVPSRKKVLTAFLLEEIHHTLKHDEKESFDCWECGKTTHWLDVEGDLFDKWEKFQESYCGC